MAGCGCGKSKTASAYAVKLPGEAPKRVTTEAQAQQMTKGVRGASYRPVK